MRTAKTLVMAFCAMLVLGTFASAQYRDSDRGRGGSAYDLYRSAHSDVGEAMNALNLLGREDPKMRDLANQVSAVGSELGGAEVEFDQGRGGHVPPPDPIGGRGPYERALNLLDRAHHKIASANDRVRNPNALSHGTNAQNRLEQVMNQLQSGNRDNRDNRDSDRGRGGSAYDLYRSAHSDVGEAMNALNLLGRDDPKMRDLANQVSAAGSELGGAEVEFDQGRGGHVPPPEPIGGRGPYERALNLLDRAHHKIASANDRVRNPNALSHGTNAQNRLEQVMNQLQSGDRRGGWDRH